MSVPQKPKREPHESQIIEFPNDSMPQRVKKWGGVVALVLGITGTLFAVPLWLVGEMEAKASEVERRVDQKIGDKFSDHKASTHDKAVPRETYDLHIAAQDKANEEAKAERKEIRQVLDVIGRQTYRSPSKWERSLEREGLKPEQESEQ